MSGEPFRAHAQFNGDFLRRHGPALRRYGRRWGHDPLALWSRRWEYPFAAQRLIEHAPTHGGEFHILDAGSGVTYLPYFLCERIAQCRVTCVDSNPAYAAMFEAVSSQRPVDPHLKPLPGADGVDSHPGPVAEKDRVRFIRAGLQELPLPDRSVDAVCCVSVLEHTDQYPRILDEFARVLRGGGVLAMTFDLSLDGRFELSRGAAARLLLEAAGRFDMPEGLDIERSLAAMEQRDRILSTDAVRRSDPELLPWKWPRVLAIYDLLCGRGWTGGFRSKTVYCVSVTARQGARA